MKSSRAWRKRKRCCIERKMERKRGRWGKVEKRKTERQMGMGRGKENVEEGYRERERETMAQTLMMNEHTTLDFTNAAHQYK